MEKWRREIIQTQTIEKMNKNGKNKKYRILNRIKKKIVSFVTLSLHHTHYIDCDTQNPHS